MEHEYDERDVRLELVEVRAIFDEEMGEWVLVATEVPLRGKREPVDHWLRL